MVKGTLLITICARGGSKGIPNKNIRNVGELPLIAYTIKHAKQFSEWWQSNGGDATIELSTDSLLIKEVAASYGLVTDYSRPEALATDQAGKIPAIQDVLFFVEKQKSTQFDFILDLDVSAPMRQISDLIEAFSIFTENETANNIFSVSTARKNPYFNLVEKDLDGFYEISKKGELFLSRQTAPPVYEINGSFYFYRRRFFDFSSLRLFNNSLIYNVKHESFDLDEMLDYHFLHYLISNKLLTFEI